MLLLSPMESIVVSSLKREMTNTDPGLISYFHFKENFHLFGLKIPSVESSPSYDFEIIRC